MHSPHMQRSSCYGRKIVMNTVEGSNLRRALYFMHSDPAFSCMTDALATGTLLYYYRTASLGAGGSCQAPALASTSPGDRHSAYTRLSRMVPDKTLIVGQAHALHACRHRSRSASVPRKRARNSPERSSRRSDKDRSGRDRSPSPHRQAHLVAACEHCAYNQRLSALCGLSEPVSCCGHRCSEQ